MYNQVKDTIQNPQCFGQSLTNMLQTGCSRCKLQNDGEDDKKKCKTSKQDQFNTTLSFNFALKKLKQTQHQIEVLKNRCKVLNLKKQQISAKTAKQQNLIKLNQNALIYKLLNRNKLEKAYQKRQAKRLKMIEKSTKLKQSMIQRSSKVKMLLFNSNMQQGKKIKTQSIKNQLMCKELKQKLRLTNFSKRNQVIKYEKDVRQKIYSYRQSKITQTLRSKSRDINCMTVMANRKDHQLKQLLKQEQQATLENEKKIKKQKKKLLKYAEQNHKCSQQQKKQTKEKKHHFDFFLTTSFLPLLRSTSVQDCNHSNCQIVSTQQNQEIA